MFEEIYTTLCDDILRFCNIHGVTTAEFGRQALGDRGFYSRLKSKRTGVTLATQARIDAYIEIGPDPAGPKGMQSRERARNPDLGQKLYKVIGRSQVSSRSG